jgi:hypothetical protein
LFIEPEILDQVNKNGVFYYFWVIYN